MANKVAQYYDLIANEVPLIKAYLNKYVIDDLVNIIMEYCIYTIQKYKYDYYFKLSDVNCIKIHLRKYFPNHLEILIMNYCKNDSYINWIPDKPPATWRNVI